MTGKFIDYKKLKSAVAIRQVLLDYNIEMTERGEQLQGFCPLPGHGGKKQSPSFSVNIKKGIFQCFGCGAKGNVIDLVCFLEGWDKNDAGQFRKAAMLLHERYLVGTPPVQSSSPNKIEKTEKHQVEDTRPRVTNEPLNFTLKNLDSNHYYLHDRGLDDEVIEHFGLGYCSKGMMNGRIAIPLHDRAGKLVGYAGRFVDEKKINEDNPRYKFPGEREKDGTVYEFKKSLFVYNGFRIQEPLADLLVVEGFFGLFALWQQGYKNVVVLMGSACSAEQSRLLIDLVQADGRLWIFTDGDNAGNRCAQEIFMQVSPQRSVRRIVLAENKQPDDLTPDELNQLLKPLFSF